MKRILFIITVLLLILQNAYAMTIELEPTQIDCYYEDLDVGEKITVSYQVGEGGNLDIDFWVQDPTNSIVISTTRTTSNIHSLQANIKGRYTYCFSNEFSTMSSKRVGFNIHNNIIQNFHDSIKEHTDPLEKEIAELAESIFAVKAQQEYIVVRERQHRDTAESTNSRVKWWSMIQLILLSSVCLWQVYYLKRFFEIKRAV
ncbi:emp24/gp25L/p24 family/GOLD-domain-containing protein [Cokeromyces recurvatus]|uniref:emp24/gp25L/p24 family/GOLD-domain-containing protein n=1 Tax=Cokeromyces recurvatus TaxID=90255 RepID=UPI00221FB6DE|nr:emp24/gp25L/p24 family/GOLD-domain-containing protein [Cokeromyces recurvatus]KAI7902325.1 emp24/gp25L/p24 family/GOLD-domain-containing protein [Cokeromyces recurvatus]